MIPVATELTRAASLDEALAALAAGAKPIAAMVPASPMPLTPSGLDGDGVTVRSSSMDGRSAADGIPYSTSVGVRSCPSSA